MTHAFRFILPACAVWLAMAPICPAQTSAPSDVLPVISLSQQPLVPGQWVIISDQRNDQTGKQIVTYFKQEIASSTSGRNYLIESTADAAGLFKETSRLLVNPAAGFESLRLTPQRAAEQTLDIGGTKYACRVEAYVFTAAGSTSTRALMLWRSPGLVICPPALPIPNADNRIVRLPDDTVQCEWTIHTDDYDSKRRITLRSAQAVVRIGQRDIACSQYRDAMVAKHKNGKDLAVVLDVWLNDTILGRDAKWIQYDSRDVTQPQTIRTVTDFKTPTPTDETPHADH